MFGELICTVMSIGMSAAILYFAPTLKINLLTCTQGSLCFLLALLVSPIILIFVIIVLIYRIIITVYLKVAHGGKFALCSPSDASVAVEEYANAVSINTFSYVKGQTNLDALRERFLTNIIYHTNEDGNQPYQKLTWKLVNKLGFFTWELRNEAFDIKEHVKICHGMDCDTIYTERDVQNAIENWVDYTMSPDKPQWELLFVPKVSLETDLAEKDELHFATIFRVQHSYMDGVSCFQTLRRFCDEFGQLSIDPVNPPIPRISRIQLITLYTRTFFTLPYTCLKMITNSGNITPELTKNTGPKYFKYTDTEISLESVKLIRKTYNCSTTAIFNSAITGAIGRTAEKGGVSVPPKVGFGSTLAMMPYPNEDPQNKFVVYILPSPISIKNPVERLHKMDSIMKTISLDEILALRTVVLLIGTFPVAFITSIYRNLNCGFGVSNMPGFTHKQTLFGGTMKGIYGTPPIKNGIGIGVGVCSYNGKIHTTWLVERTKLVPSREKMNALLAYFEDEFKILECAARDKIFENSI